MHREGNILKNLYHPHIIQLIEIIETESVLCLVLEILDMDVLVEDDFADQYAKQAADYTRVAEGYRQQFKSQFKVVGVSNVLISSRFNRNE